MPAQPQALVEFDRWAADALVRRDIDGFWMANSKRSVEFG